MISNKVKIWHYVSMTLIVLSVLLTSFTLIMPINESAYRGDPCERNIDAEIILVLVLVLVIPFMLVGIVINLFLLKHSLHKIRLIPVINVLISVLAMPVFAWQCYEWVELQKFFACVEQFKMYETHMLPFRLTLTRRMNVLKPIVEMCFLNEDIQP